ncbi:MAG: hypothetical protein HY320_01930 [Armatimonadetes bacterium]|nr:hypothetical protein [Armatimonadota bacterium]
MFGSNRPEAVVLRRIARRVEDILEAARERERQGQRLSLEIDARFQLQDLGAVQFQLASAILEEAGGLRQDEVVSELLSLGLAAVLDGAAKAARQPPVLGLSVIPDEEEGDGMEDGLGVRSVLDLPRRDPVPGSRTIH